MSALMTPNGLIAIICIVPDDFLEIFYLNSCKRCQMSRTIKEKARVEMLVKTQVCEERQ